MKRYIRPNTQPYLVRYTLASGGDYCEVVDAESSDDAYNIIYDKYADQRVIPDEIFVEEISPEELQYYR